MNRISRILRGSALALVIGSTAWSAFADGPYLGGSIGGAHLRGDPIGGLDTDRSATGGKLYAGWSFNPYFALEGGYADLGRFDGDGGRLGARGLFLDGVGTYPLGNGFSALGRLGLFTGRLHESLNPAALNGPVDDSGNGTRFKLGAGLQYDLSKTVALRGEWEQYHFHALDESPSVNLFSVGLNYRF